MLRSKKQEAGSHIKASAGSKVFDAVNVTLLVLLALTTFLSLLGLYGGILFLAEKLSGHQYPSVAFRVVAGRLCLHG